MRFVSVSVTSACCRCVGGGRLPVTPKLRIPVTSEAKLCVNFACSNPCQITLGISLSAKILVIIQHLIMEPFIDRDKPTFECEPFKVI